MVDRTHLTDLEEQAWAFWRWIGLRSAGFPVDWLFRLSPPECAAAADALLAAERAREQALDAALARLRQRLEQSDLPERDVIAKAIRKLNKGHLTGLVPPAGATEELERLEAAQQAVEIAREAFKASFQRGMYQVAQHLGEIARDERFREAITWQNRHALRTGVDSLLRSSAGGGGRSSKHRQHEALVVSYLQRYCAKNDTIGFFGPVGWATAADTGSFVQVCPGQEILAERNVYFEGWGIDTLAETLAGDEALLPWLAPRLLPFIHLDGTTLYLPLAAPTRISAGQAAVLQRCDGTRTARELAREVLTNPANGFQHEQDIYALLRHMRELRRIVWTLEVPAEGLHPEQTLRRLIERIGDAHLREPALNALAELETAVGAVAAAAGNAGQLDQAIGHVEATFTRLTGVAATRRAGSTYAGRTLLYEDTRRDVAVTFGPTFTAALGPPLALLLASARWFTYEAAVRYRKAFRKIYSQLAQKARSRTVEFASFWFMAHSLIFGEDSSPIEPLEQELQERWAAILALPPSQRHVAYQSAALREQVLAAFQAPHPGWKTAAYHTPDVMLAAPSVEALQRGDFQFVLGEIHPGANTLRSAFFVAQHPQAGDLFAALKRDIPEPKVMIVGSREAGGTTLRMSTGLLAPEDYRFIFAHDTCGVSPEHALPISTLVIEEAGGALVVRTRDRRLRFDIIDVLGEFIMLNVLHHFSIIPPADHTPRITLDRMIIGRETWRFLPNSIPFAATTDEAERFITARRWMHAHGLPRHVFVKTRTEKKPFYVDFESPISLDLFARAIRRVSESDTPGAPIGVSEMLPAPDQTWLTDADGQRYTCELRIVAVDQG